MHNLQTTTVAGITYSKPTVILLQETGIGTAELAARTCYDSFDSSENGCVQAFNNQLQKTINSKLEFPSLSGLNQTDISHVNRIKHSNLLDTLAWTHFHHSILEHANLTYLIKGTSRGVLQEHARHRLQAISVRSTRYTMGSIINAFIASLVDISSIQFFANKLKEMNLFVLVDNEMINIEIECIFNKLLQQRKIIGKEAFTKLCVPKASLHLLEHSYTHAYDLFEALQAGKKKRNVGDAFKHIVNDNWKVDMVVTFNLRSLKNYFELRSSSSAYFQIHWLANEMIKITPRKYLDLILKQDKINKVIY